MRPFIHSLIFFLCIPVFVFAEDRLPTEEAIRAYRDSLEVYQKQIRRVLAEERPENAIALEDYINICMDVSRAYDALNQQLVSDEALFQSIRRRVDKRDDLLLMFRRAAAFPGEREILFLEGQAYEKLGQLPADRLLGRLRARILLSDRKYFEPDDKSKASPLEIVLNGLFGFTSTELYDLSGPHYGIKPWEMNARFEPVGFVKQKNMTGVMFSMGTIYNLFPEVSVDASTAHLRENFLSRNIKRIGFKLGAGARLKDRPEWVAGTGIQIRAVTVWGLYGFDTEKMEIAFGLNDISWLKYVLPYMD